MRLSFYLDAFDIEKLVRKKIVSTSFGGAVGYRERAPGANTTHARTIGASTARPLRGEDRAPRGAWAAVPLRKADLSAT